MVQGSSWKEFKIETPANYRVRVQGEIDSTWSDIIGDMDMSIDFSKDKNKVTNLVGYLVDQAALSGLLKALYDQRIPILSVENLDEKKKNNLFRQKEDSK